MKFYSRVFRVLQTLLMYLHLSTLTLPTFALLCVMQVLHIWVLVVLLVKKRLLQQQMPQFQAHFLKQQFRVQRVLLSVSLLPLISLLMTLMLQQALLQTQQMQMQTSSSVLHLMKHLTTKWLLLLLQQASAQMQTASLTNPVQQLQQQMLLQQTMKMAISLRWTACA